MARNSSVSEPSYNLARFGQQAWVDTRLYIEDAFAGSLGSVNHPVLGNVLISKLLRDTYFKSIGLLLVALLISTALGLWMGSFAALVKKQHVVFALLLLTILGISAPSFFAGFLLQYGETLYFRTFGTQLVKMAGFGWDVEHMLMPILVLMARPLAYLTRASYISLSHVMDENYIRTAYAKGLLESWVVSVHAMRNIAVPVLTAVGVSLRFSLSTLPVVEFFFAWPGVGLRLLEAINAGQLRVVVTLALALGMTFLLVNLLLDIVYRLVDPRLRENEV